MKIGDLVRLNEAGRKHYNTAGWDLEQLVLIIAKAPRNLKTKGVFQTEKANWLVLVGDQAGARIVEKYWEVVSGCE